MTIPESAIEAAAEAMEDEALRLLGRDLGTIHRNGIARAAIEAAMPAIREAIAQEFMTAPLPRDVADSVNVKRWFVEGVRWAAELVRGGTP